ncbi:hypothetical protein [Micromonospora sp. HUAS LYJ1]|uniref:hypothetical protein n=1 Tax=Micromonospora sp. HUAS LYJ1 TaxID=3061626 RepID=UPI0026710DF8|nr:hypothetical protein [Micromonospora sp. HUAS LYJ1]WKU03513.1 hypothetical protein Q2K16_22025 [Micromonospora sp. HUAS LYJ1]
MNRVTHVLTINQLLGRIVYFHAMFIEPALEPSTARGPDRVCCNHGPASDRSTVGELLPDSPWLALVEVAATLPAHHQPCLQADSACCATCRVTATAAAIAAGWAQTECRSYQRTEPDETLLHSCRLAAAARLGRAFATQHAASCPVLDRLTVPEPLPGKEELPLTSELLTLWANPTANTHHPVASWLNHCTGLDDVRQVLETRRTDS